MQTLFGVKAWDYTGTLGSIDGRTNLMFGMTWGVLGAVWIRFLLPLVLRLIAMIPFKWHIPFTVALSVFMAFDVAVTLAATARQNERLHDIDVPPTNVIEQTLDTYFPDEWMQERFHNTTMYAQFDSNGEPVAGSQAH
jgi:uncharacterized membrane protein